MYFRVKLKMTNPTLCCCFTWIEFIELNFTVTFLLIRKTCNGRFVGKVRGWEISRNGGILVIEEWFQNGGVWYPMVKKLLYVAKFTRKKVLTTTKFYNLYLNTKNFVLLNFLGKPDSWKPALWKIFTIYQKSIMLTKLHSFILESENPSFSLFF